MRHYYTAEQIRAAEAPLLAALPDGVLMRRAATGSRNDALIAGLRVRIGDDVYESTVSGQLDALASSL